LTWPRGTNNAYIFGGGVWFATKKVIQGRTRKLCELGYNPNSGAGWYTEGEINGASDGASSLSKYITYMSPRYDNSGKFSALANEFTPSPQYRWPIWDTARAETLKRNFYFGDYISDVGV